MASKLQIFLSFFAQLIADKGSSLHRSDIDDINWKNTINVI